MRAFLAAGTVLGAMGACGPLPDSRPSDLDLRPPQVQSVEAVGPGELRVRFDEEATLVQEKTRISPDLGAPAIARQGATSTITARTQAPGRLYVLETEARDARGNSSSFLAEFYGFNDKVPALLINELTPRGSATHPDLTELAVLSDGNMGGVVLYNGTPGSFDSRMVFPALAVRKGSFLVVHWKPSGDPAEVDETAGPAASAGLDACVTAWDFWVWGGTGLGGNNGVLSLYDRPGGKCLDGVLYSNRTSQSDEGYRGFGSNQVLLRAEELVRDGGWKPAGARIVPEDGVSPELSTATRSLCRSSSSADTDRAEDWHVVPTRKATFGLSNSDDVHVP